MKADDLDVLVLDEHDGNVSKEWQAFSKTPISIFWAFSSSPVLSVSKCGIRSDVRGFRKSCNEMKFLASTAETSHPG